jgi:hypothetical protein
MNLLRFYFNISIETCGCGCIVSMCKCLRRNIFFFKKRPMSIEKCIAIIHVSPVIAYIALHRYKLYGGSVEKSSQRWL